VLCAAAPAAAQPLPSASQKPPVAQPKPPVASAKPAPPKPTAVPSAKPSAAPTASAAVPAPSASASAEPVGQDGAGGAAFIGPPLPPPPEPEPPPEPSSSAEPAASVQPPPIAPPAASASPLPSASSLPAPAGSGAVAVKLHDSRVFSVHVGRGGVSAEKRAADASAALKRAVEGGGQLEVTVEQRGEIAIVFLGPRPLIELGPEDAAAAGEASVQIHAARVAAQVRESIGKEQSRSATLMTLLRFAVVVFSMIAAVFLVRRLGELTDRARAWLAEHPDKVPAIRLRSIEVIRPASLRAGLLVALSAGKALAQIGVLYGWVLLSLSLFESTRAYAERLTGFVFGPLYSLVARVVGSLPLVLVAAIAMIALVVLLRFVGLFFESVGRSETELEWLPADLAPPTSLLVRSAVVLLFFVIAAPLVTGNDDGALTRAGTVALVALGLATTPLLACAAVGATVVYGRRLRVGDWAEFGGRAGRVQGITLLEVQLEDDSGRVVRVPHLLGLLHPTTVSNDGPRVSVEIALAPETACRDELRKLMREAAEVVGKGARVELVALEADAARWRISVVSTTAEARTDLYAVLSEALETASIKLARPAA
jgi:small-conductance mechanosensitive channel